MRTRRPGATFEKTANRCGLARLGISSVHHPEVLCSGMPFTSRGLGQKGRKTERRHLWLMEEREEGAVLLGEG